MAIGQRSGQTVPVRHDRVFAEAPHAHRNNTSISLRSVFWPATSELDGAVCFCTRVWCSRLSHESDASPCRQAEDARVLHGLTGNLEATLRAARAAVLESADGPEAAKVAAERAYKEYALAHHGSALDAQSAPAVAPAGSPTADRSQASGSVLPCACFAAANQCLCCMHAQRFVTQHWSGRHGGFNGQVCAAASDMH